MQAALSLPSLCSHIQLLPHAWQQAGTCPSAPLPSHLNGWHHNYSPCAQAPPPPPTSSPTSRSSRASADPSPATLPAPSSSCRWAGRRGLHGGERLVVWGCRCKACTATFLVPCMPLCSPPRLCVCTHSCPLPAGRHHAAGGEGQAAGPGGTHTRLPAVGHRLCGPPALARHQVRARGFGCGAVSSEQWAGRCEQRPGSKAAVPVEPRSLPPARQCRTRCSLGSPCAYHSSWEGCKPTRSCLA